MAGEAGGAYNFDTGWKEGEEAAGSSFGFFVSEGAAVLSSGRLFGCAEGREGEAGGEVGGGGGRERGSNG
jgi:hypothetical protein